MKHARTTALDRLADLLAALRAMPGLAERRPGIFYRKSRAFLHFHEDPAGLFADLRCGGAWLRCPLDTDTQQQALLAQVRQHVGAAAGRRRPV